MRLQNLLERIERLAKVPGPSGFEDAVCIAIQGELGELASETVVDGIGNLVLRLPAETNAPSLMLMAHMDQIGFVVKYIDNDGSIYCERIGLVDERTILASAIDIWTDHGPRAGVIGVRSRHLVSEAELANAPRIDDLWILVGATSDSEVAELGIEIGQPATVHGEHFLLNERTLVGRSIDNRAGCATLIEVAKLAAERDREIELIFVWSTQEEVGSRGARVAASWLQPTIAVVIDTLPAGDPSTPRRHATTRIGHGPVIRAQDSRGVPGTIYSTPIRRQLHAVARELDIPCQVDVFPTWTDACEVHLAGRGIPTGGVFIPRLCSHSPNEILDVNDAVATVSLLDRFVQLDADTVRKLSTRPTAPLGGHS
jgi:tetrahedral aminopeptidase